MAKSYGGTNRDHLMNYYLAVKEEADNAIKNIRAAQDVSLAQYMCQKDWSDKKQPWQSKIYIPLAKATIKKAVRLVKKAMLDSEYYFDFKVIGKDPNKKKMANVMRQVLMMHLTSDKFIETFSECLESGFVLGEMIMKIWVENVPRHYEVDVKRDEYVKRNLPRLRLRAVNPYDFHFTPDKRIMIEDEFIKVHDLIEFSEQPNSNIDKRVLNELINGDYSGGGDVTDRDARLLKLGITEHSNQFRHDVLISHVWGPVINAKGRVTMENAHWLVANDKYPLTQPEPNPFIHGKAPYIIGSPIPVIFRHLGKGLIEDVAGIEDAIVNFVNLQLDNLKWIVLGINEVDELALSDKAKEEMRDMFPGKLVTRRSGYEKPAFNHTEMGTPPEKAMPMLQELKQFREMDTNVTEYIQSTPGSRQDTLGEYEGKRGSAMQDFASIASDIEKGFMVDCIDMARDLVVQYCYQFDKYPEIKVIFEDSQINLNDLSASGKKALIVNDLELAGRGISIFFERMDKLNKLGTYVKMLNALPESAQDYPRWNEILRRINDAFSFDNREDLVNSDEQVAKLQQNKMKTAQEQLMQQVRIQQMEWQKEMEIERMKISAELQKLRGEMVSDEKDRDLDWAIALLKAKVDSQKTKETKVNKDVKS